MKLSTILLAILVLILVGLVSFLWWSANGPKPVAEVPIQARFEDKIVYTTDQSVDREMLARHCQTEGGSFNECGSACAKDAEVCAETCAFTCELKLPEKNEITIEEEFTDKIVYSSNTDISIEPLRKDCEKRNGTFNECGSPCPATAESCVKVCAFTCDLSNQQTINIPSDWQFYTNQSVGFSLYYPPKMNVRVSSQDEIVFELWGPTQREGTELFDGITFIVNKEIKESEKTLEDYVNEKITERQEGTLIAQPSEISISGKKAIAYDYQSVGIYHHVYVPVSTSTVMTITYLNPDPTDQGYVSQTETMLQSFRAITQQ